MKHVSDLNRQDTAPTLVIVNSNPLESEDRSAMPTSKFSEQDKKDIAKYLADELRGPFTMSAKDHYDAHTQIESMAEAFNGARSIFTKIFVGLVVLGSLALAGVSLFGKKLGLP